MFTQSDSLRKCLGGKTQIPCLSTNSKREWEMRSKSLTRGCTEEFIPTFSFLIRFQTIRKFDMTQQTRIVQPYCIWKGILRDINADHQDTLPPTSQSVKKTKMANMASTNTSSRKKHSLYQICIFGTTLTTIATFNWEFMEKPHETGEITDTATTGSRCFDHFSFSPLVYFFHRLGCWFNMLKRPKSRQHGPLSANGAGHNATSKATDTQWHWLMADCRPGVSWPLRLDLYTPSH